jgi:hypothetical protein
LTTTSQEGIVMRYHQITREERYTLAAMRTQHPPLSKAEMARRLGRHPSTILREVRRNAARHDGAYRASKAQERTNGRRSRTRRWSKLTQKSDMLRAPSMLQFKVEPKRRGPVPRAWRMDNARRRSTRWVRIRAPIMASASESHSAGRNSHSKFQSIRSRRSEPSAGSAPHLS